MNGQEYLMQLSKKSIDEQKVARIQNIYNARLSEEVKRMVSNCDETVFLDDNIRILSFAELVDAEMDLHVDFKKKKILPVADCGENDFIVFHYDDGSWSKFNIIDEVVFKKKMDLINFFK